MNALNVRKQLNMERKPLYIITGKDSYYRRESLYAFKSLVTGYAVDMNLDYYEANDGVDKVISSLNTPAFMADIRLVIWQGGVKINAELAKTIATAIKAYLKNPNPSAMLVLVDEGEYFKSCYKLGEQVVCEKLETSELMRIVSEKITTKGYATSNNAIKDIIVRADNDMETINCELEKVYAYAIDTKVIDESIVNDCVINNIEQDIYKLSNAVSIGNVSLTYVLLNELLARGEAPLKLLAMITSMFRRVFLCKISKLNDEELAKQIGVNPYALKMARAVAKNFKPMKLKMIVDALQNIEYECKQGKLSIDDGLQKGICIALNNK